MSEILTDSVEQTLLLLIENHVNLGSLSVSTPNLEDLFIKLTGHSLRT